MNGFGAVLPMRGPGESAEAFLDRLMPALEDAFYSITGPATANTYDSQGRVILSPAGHTVYRDDGSVAIAPNVIQIDTDDLAEGAVTLAQTDIPELVLANRAVIGDALVLRLLAGDVEAVEATIDNLRVNNANIANMSVTKLLAGTIGVNGVYIGSPAFELAGADRQLRVKDAQTVPVTRVELGKLGAGAADYGLVIRGADGSVILSANGLGLAVVGTANIAAGSASAPVSSFANNPLPIGEDWTVVRTVTVPVTEPDAVVSLAFTCACALIASTSAATVQARITRDGAPFGLSGSNVAYADAGGTCYVGVPCSIDDSPGVGEVTYRAEMRWVSGSAPTTCTAQARHFFALQIKR